MTDQLCSQVLSLPIFPELDQEQQQTVIDTVTQLLERSRPTPLPVPGDQERIVA